MRRRPTETMRRHEVSICEGYMAEPYLMLGQARNAMFNVEGIAQHRKPIN